jgi:transporter family protein
MGKSMLNVILVVITIIAWGLWGFFEKEGVMYGHPLVVSIIIAISAFVVEVPIFIFILRKSSVEIALNRQVVIYSFFAELCLASAALAILYLLRDNPTGWAISITSVYPIVTLILGAIFLNETVTVSNVVGIVVIGIGMIILNSS